MKTERYNIFNLIHKGLRAMLFDTAIALQQTNFTQHKQATILFEKLEQVLTFFEEHADHEDQFILPAIEKYNLQLVNEFEEEHIKDKRLTEDLMVNITTWKFATVDEERIKIGQQIFYTYNEFMAFNLSHLNKEELLLNEVLWENYTDEEIWKIEQEILKGIAPEKLWQQSRWMMRSISDREVINWLMGIKKFAPTEVYNMFLQLAKEELPVERKQTIANTIAVDLN